MTYRVAVPSPFDCQIWWAHPGHATDSHGRLFTEAERSRAARYRRKIDRDRFTVGCALSRRVLGPLLGMPAAAVPLRRDCDECGRPHGRPRLPGDPWHLSVTHSGDHVALAITAAGPVGVDVERIDPSVVKLSEAVLTEPELVHWRKLPESARAWGLIRYWVRKEAILKALGTGLRQSMTSLRVSGPNEPAAVLTSDSSYRHIALSDLDVDSAHLGAVAVLTEEKPRFTTHDGAPILAER